MQVVVGRDSSQVYSTSLAAVWDQMEWAVAGRVGNGRIEVEHQQADDKKIVAPRMKLAVFEKLG